MNVLIIGSEGFIGSYCTRYFSDKGHSITGLDLVDQAQGGYAYLKVSRSVSFLDEVLRNTSFDLVINAAGNGNVNYSMTHPVNDFESNCLDTIYILDAIRNHRPACRYIHLSSAAVYGNPVRLPISESDAVKPVSPYGWNKYISEQLCQEYSIGYGLHTAVLRPFSVYGAGLKKQLFWDTFQKWRKKDNDIELFGTGAESRDFIHVLDVMNAIGCILDKAAFSGEVYNVASGRETTIKEAIGIFWKSFGSTPVYTFNGKVREGDPLNWRADISNLKNIGFRSTVDLPEGLMQVTDWMKKHHL